MTVTSLEQQIYDTIEGNWTDLTLSMLADTVLEFERDNQPLHEVVDLIPLVMANKETALGDEFAARVWEALSYTREDGGSIFDCDHER